MNSKILGLLEFNRILDLLAEQAGSAVTRERIAELVPMSNRHMVQDALTETTEAVSVILYKGNIPVGEIGDISGILGMARKGRILSMRELLQVRTTLSITRTAKAFLSDDMPSGLKLLPEICSLLEPVPKLEHDIESAILSEDEMSDSASPELRRIRREIRNKNDLIKSRLQKMVTSGSAKDSSAGCNSYDA